MGPVLGRWYHRAWASPTLEASAVNSQRSGMVSWRGGVVEEEEEVEEVEVELEVEVEGLAAFTFLVQPPTGCAYPSPR
jgi:hypothetical protein